VKVDTSQTSKTKTSIHIRNNALGSRNAKVLWLISFINGIISVIIPRKKAEANIIENIVIVIIVLVIFLSD
jgi:hypothetical protein